MIWACTLAAAQRIAVVVDVADDDDAQTTRTTSGLFPLRLMVEHLLRACLPDELLAAPDLSSLRKLSAEYVSRRTAQAPRRRGVAGTAGRLLGVLTVLLEFQPTGSL